MVWLTHPGTGKELVRAGGKQDKARALTHLAQSV